MTAPEIPDEPISPAMDIAAWTEARHAVCREEFEAMLRSAGFQPGWRVLDAGCGGGTYLAALAELVGPTGAIVALDAEPEVVALAEARVAAQPLACPVETRVGELTALPFPDDAFDALWCADTAQYLDDEALAATLAEFRRVVRPGGLIAVKDADASVLRSSRPSVFVIGRLLRANYEADEGRTRGAWRGPELRGALQAAGLEGVWLRTTVVERFAPLDPLTREFMVGAISIFAGMAMQSAISAEDRAEWARLGQTVGREVERPDFFYREGNVLAVGRVPER
jgi:ubiquinone/menaquinone biosynthesis C-methylase UbiE